MKNKINFSQTNLLHSLHNLHTVESTLDESDSYIFLSNFLFDKKHYYTYKYPDISYEDIHSLTSKFCVFCAKVKDAHTNSTYISNVPIHVLRYVLLQDGSWSFYYTPKRKLGYIVEAFCWSNGLLYQVREDKPFDFEVYEITLLIDGYTKSLHSFP